MPQAQGQRKSVLLIFIFTITILIPARKAGGRSAEEVKACAGHWLEFTCKYPKAEAKYRHVRLDGPNLPQSVESGVRDRWDGKGRISLFHDTQNGALRVRIKELGEGDSGEYVCTFDTGARGRPPSSKVKVGLDDGDCQADFTQRAYVGTPSRIACDYPREVRNATKFLCRDDGVACADISTSSNGTASSSTFSIGEKVTPEHAGVYWCGLATAGGRRAVRKVSLTVEIIRRFKRTAIAGRAFGYWCAYPAGSPADKFICKGPDTWRCPDVAGRFVMRDDETARNISVSLTRVAADDAGTFWCGARSAHPLRASDAFYHKLELTVVPPTSSSLDSPSAGALLVTVAAVVVVVLLLLLAIVVAAVRKSKKKLTTGTFGPAYVPVRSPSTPKSRRKSTRTGLCVLGHPRGSRQTEDDNVTEEPCYAEIQERQEETGSGSTTVYARADFPAAASDSCSSFHPAVL
ncbi:uncharacterized protein LOC133483922 isoform X6 [Phyllopteryx taeniolatus]|uniref:uncharacterized protein LOC133483922 isoform X6 n=1 Tax=Phyllopteryx taeniolatus TaxID=161469 RepID=UPI002AD427B9|nr:uncharacterized protein LOC133483922 isoform X6 [Phyllopteryx taeniolatus]